MNTYKNQCPMTPGRCGVEKERAFSYEKERWPLGMTYVPMQEWRKLYQADEGFRKGTIFCELDLPFLGRRMC